MHWQSTFGFCIFICFCIIGSIAPPVSKAKAKEEKKPIDDLMTQLSYGTYVKEVSSILESNKEFAKRIQNLSKVEDLASQLEFVDHSVRTRLDEIKRKEIERLNGLEKMLEAKLAAKGDPMKEAEVPIHPEVFNMDQQTIRKAHLDHENPHSFEAADLEKLIKQVTQDLKIVDQAKEEQYKQYEMTKEHLRKRKLKKMNDTKAREEAEKHFQEEKQKHKQHEKVHQPGSQEQLQDAWVEEDHMDKKNFNPKTFFMLHDVNGDGHLDVSEIEALFLKELEKVYAHANDSTVNEFEKQHEMERMRRELLEKIDTNKDMMISWSEFERWTKGAEFKKDDDWKTSEEEDTPPYKEDEFKNFEEEYDKEHPDDDEDHERRDSHDRDKEDHADSREHDDAGGKRHRDGDRGRGSEHHEKEPEHHDKIPEHHEAVPEHHDKALEHHDKAPEHHEKVLEHHDKAPEHHEKVPEHHDKAPEHHEVPEHHDKIPEHHDKIPEHHDKAPEHHDKVPEHHDKTPEHHEKVPEHHDKVPEHHDKVPEHHDKVPEHHDKAPEHHEKAAEHHDAAPPHPAVEHHDKAPPPHK